MKDAWHRHTEKKQYREERETIEKKSCGSYDVTVAVVLAVDVEWKKKVVGKSKYVE